MPCPDGQISTGLGCVPVDPVGFAGKFYSIGLGLIGGVALLYIIYGGYIILTSGGNPGQLKKGKSFIFYSIVGLLLAIFGYVFIQVIVVDILHIQGFS